MKSFLVWLLVIFFHFNLMSQKLDSLRDILAHHHSKDTLRVHHLNNLAEQITLQNQLSDAEIDEIIRLADEASKISDSLNWLAGKAESFRSIGMFYYLKANYSQAIYYYNLAIKNFESAKCINNKYLSCLFFKGYINLIHRNYKASQKDFLKSIELSSAINDKINLSQSYLYLGTNFRELKQYTVALDNYLKALKIYEDLGDTLQIANVMEFLGSIYTILEDFKKAQFYQNLALKYYEKKGLESQIRMANNNLGNTYNELKYFSDAKTCFLKVLENNKDSMQIFPALANLGCIYLEMKDLNTSLKYHNKAIEIITKLKLDFYLSREYLNVGEIYYQLKRDSLSLYYLSKAIDIANEFNILEDQKTVSEHLAKLYSSMGNYKKAYEYHVAFKKYNDSIFNEKNIKKITELELTYKFEKEKQIAQLKQQKKDALESEKKHRQRIVIAALLIVFILVVILTILIFRNYKKQKKYNNILHAQKTEIEERNEELNLLNETLSEHRDALLQQKKNITDSILYAKFIQQTLLSSHAILDNYRLSHFILYKPKDIVSGDFYWFKQVNNKLFFAAADCTGHGVPGAFMSVLGISLLNEIVNKNELNSPARILNELRKHVKSSLKQKGTTVPTSDGMDIALCLLDFETKELQYAGANIPLILIRNNELREYDADKFPVAAHPKDNQNFSDQIIQLESNDTLYLYSDGYISQFGGVNTKKMSLKQFKSFLLEISHLPLTQQKEKLEQYLTSWQVGIEQVDDILILSIKV